MKRKKGQSIIELIIALLLVSIVLVAVVGLITKGISNNNYIRNKTIATNYSEEVFEWLRSQRDNNWNQFYSITATSKWCLPSLTFTSPSHSGSCAPADVIPQTIFTRELTFTRVTSPTISVDAKVVVSWSDSAGLHTSESTTTFTNWKGNQ